MKLAYNADLGLLIARCGLGIMFVLHGLPKLFGGPKAWEGLAQTGLPFLPEGAIAMAFGLAAAVTEALGGLLLALGVFHRWVCAALAGVMFVALTTKLGKFEGFMDFAFVVGWPLELAIIFITLFFTGPGAYRIAAKS